MLQGAWVFDLETHLISTGRQAPPDVCLSRKFGCFNSEGDTELFSREQVPEKFLEMLGSSFAIVGHNIAFDLTVLMANYPSLIAPIFKGLDEGRFICTLLMSRLYENALGTLQRQGKQKLEHETVGPFSLAGCVFRYLGRDISEGKQAGSWRYRFAELADLSVEDYPAEAADYAKADADNTLDLYRALLLLAETPRVPDQKRKGRWVFFDAPARTRAAVALRLMECWGIRTDPERVKVLEGSVEEVIQSARSVMQREKLMREDETTDMGALRERVRCAYAAKGEVAPVTDKGSTRTDRTTLRESGDPILEGWAAAGFAFKVKSTFLPQIKEGTTRPLHCRYQVMVETGRTSCSRPNLQQIPRASGKLGVRETFIPRPGMAFVAADYDALEMRTFAQVLLDDVGRSEMADQFQADPNFDPHLFFAEHLSQGKWGSLSESEKKDLRTRSKAANFGFSGALGIRTFVSFCKGFGLHLTENDAQGLKTLWFNKYPEVRQYFRNISSRLDPFENTGTVFHERSHRIRGQCSFTQCANSPFQGMGADGCLHSLHLIAKACYADPDSPLFGSRPVLYIHDEIVMETPIAMVHSAGLRLCELMEQGMSLYVPDIPIRASPIAMDRWSKNAEAVFDSSGELVVWRSKSEL